MEKMDAEKVAVARAVGLADVWSTKQWYERSYGISGETLYDVLQHNHYYAGFHAPSHYLGYHHVLDEVPNTLVPIASFGAVLGVPTPAIDAIITLASAMVGVDFRQEGRTVETLGLGGLDAPAMMRYVA